MQQNGASYKKKNIDMITTNTTRSWKMVRRSISIKNKINSQKYEICYDLLVKYGRVKTNLLQTFRGNCTSIQ